MNEEIRKEFLEYFIENATKEEILEKLIQNDKRAKQLNAIKKELKYFNEMDNEEFYDWDLLRDECIENIERIVNYNE